MTDFFDDLAMPPDGPDAEGVIGTEVVSETWFAEFDSVVPEVGNVPLPDPFSAETGAGVAAGLSALLARRRKPEPAAPAAPATPAAPAAMPSDLQTITAAVDLAEATAPLLERLVKLARPKRRAR